MRRSADELQLIQMWDFYDSGELISHPFPQLGGSLGTRGLDACFQNMRGATIKGSTHGACWVRCLHPWGAVHGGAAPWQLKQPPLQHSFPVATEACFTHSLQSF